jgi:hypothetical protein
MRHFVFAAIAAATFAATLTIDAQAMPVAPKSLGQDVESNVTVVRDGCGWNRYYNRRLGRCVWTWRR